VIGGVLHAVSCEGQQMAQKWPLVDTLVVAPFHATVTNAHEVMDLQTSIGDPCQGLAIVFTKKPYRFAIGVEVQVLRRVFDECHRATTSLEGRANILPATRPALLFRHDEEVAVQIEQDPWRLVVTAGVVAQPVMGFEADVHDA